MINEPKWTKTKPDFACVFVGKNDNAEFNIWQFSWQFYESYYLTWLNADGEEWDNIGECSFDWYLVIELLPTLDEVIAKRKAELKNAYEVITNESA